MKIKTTTKPIPTPFVISGVAQVQEAWWDDHHRPNLTRTRRSPWSMRWLRQHLIVSPRWDNPSWDRSKERMWQHCRTIHSSKVLYLTCPMIELGDGRNWRRNLPLSDSRSRTSITPSRGMSQCANPLEVRVKLEICKVRLRVACARYLCTFQCVQCLVRVVRVIIRTSSLRIGRS